MKSLLIAALASLALAGPTQAEFTSAYIDLRLDRDCLVLDADDFGVSWSCPGYKGYPVHVSEGDLRFSIVYGFNIDQESGGQTLGPFNELGGARMAAEQCIGPLDAGGDHRTLPHFRRPERRKQRPGAGGDAICRGQQLPYCLRRRPGQQGCQCTGPRRRRRGGGF
ncbi:MAG: hypothetical protein MO852_08785 [Candidatus Devosia euplotis]|nr:hypothetical protein [Candidatus Devosia euplotis]